jgi:hypothetical protein|tara:strand:- start:105 stop:770 length:666 start_codon:yes stop_codon:yes gene_type:complete
MALKLNLVVENPDVIDNFEIIEEETNKNSPSNLFIKGPYMMAEGVNRNNRLYPRQELEREVARYNEEMVIPGRAMGELNHPSSADVDLERACHMVTELTQDGNIFYGKSKVLSTPCGQVVRSLINDGVKLGMSSRALGSLEEGTNHNTVRNLKLVAVDCVADPSYSSAFVNGILESKQYVLAQDGSYEEIYDKFEESIKTLPRKDVDAYLRERFMNFIKNL